MHVYVAGPMRGYHQFNFPAFAKASEFLRGHHGWEVTSPAEMDLEMGLDPDIANTDAEADFDVEDALRRDFEVILKADGLVLIEGWENSSGARAERFVAETTGKHIFFLRPVGGSFAIEEAPAWDGDPRKPAAVRGWFESRDVDDLAGAIAAIEAEGFTVLRNPTPDPITQAQADHEAFQTDYRQSLDLERQRLLSNGALKRVVTPATASYMAQQPGSFQSAVRGLTESCHPDPIRWPERVTTQPSSAPESEDSTNPKDLLGIKKPQLHLVPESFIIRVAQAMTDGARKYGPFNWRTKAVRGTVYQSAAKRHLGQWFDGEDVAEDSGVHHLAHAAACIGILIDAIETGNLVDDRPTPGAASRLIKELTT